MQDPDIPPQAEESTNGAVEGGRREEARVVRWDATARSIRGSLPRPWITATVPIWAATTATTVDQDGPAFRRRFQWSILNLYQFRGKMRLRGFSRLSRTC